MGRCGFAYFGLGNLWYHLGEEDKPWRGPVECRTCNYVETGTASTGLAEITSIMSVETLHNLKSLREGGGGREGDVEKSVSQMTTKFSIHTRAAGNHSALF